MTNVSIRVITPQDAIKLLQENYEYNRDLDPQKVNQYAKEMKDNKFVLTNDAICIDTAGKLINGQHRLHAVVKTGRAQQFVVLNNMETQAIKKMDIAKKRNRHGRLKSEAKLMPSSAAVHIVENAMAKYDVNASGSAQYSSHNYDDAIYYCYQKHADFINYVISHQLSKQTSLAGAALLMYAHMMENYDQLPDATRTYPHLQHPVERAVGFIEISKYGFSKSLPLIAKYDMPAIGINKFSQTKEWLQMTSHQRHRWYVSAAFRYMRGSSDALDRPFDDGVFKPLVQYPATARNFDSSNNVFTNG